MSDFNLTLVPVLDDDLHHPLGGSPSTTYGADVGYFLASVGHEERTSVAQVVGVVGATGSVVESLRPRHSGWSRVGPDG